VLLLVLILILIAFGLLVVALLSGSVLWAWVSVAVSAVAALVLVVDYLQRRSAARVVAGVDGGAQPPPDRAIPEADRPEPEPATEVIPILRPGAAGPSADLGGDPAARFPTGEGDQRTVAVPQRQPPGSDDRPSGAVGVPPPLTGSSSRTVTESGVEASTTKVGAVGPAESGADEATVAVQSRGGAQQDGSGDRAVDLGKGGTGAGPGGPGAGSSGMGSTGMGSTGMSGAAPAEPPSHPGRDRPAVVPAAQGGVMPSDPTVHGVAPADVPPPPDGPPPGGEPTGHPDGVDAEPPEEPREQAFAAIVAQLPDEVVVVDEQPRYHLGSCRSLAARAVIPLPVREAVELGFTPCGWCAPDRTLAERHPARAQ
jgi:hypothetical protein